MEPPPPSPPGAGACAVCCMCGDRGLPHELVRCKLCRVRLQHRYCSDLYPTATAYRRCNWCLREPAAEGIAQAYAHAVASKTAGKRKTVASTETSASDEEEGKRQWHEQAVCSATRSAAEVGKPVKKPKVDERAALPPSPGSPAKKSNGDKKPMQAGKLARPGRVKVRRYRLLAEVISC